MTRVKHGSQKLKIVDLRLTMNDQGWQELTMVDHDKAKLNIIYEGSPLLTMVDYG